MAHTTTFLDSEICQRDQFVEFKSKKKKQKNFVHEWNKKIKLRKSVHKNTLWQ